jgi:tetratricopeptide (TPR) repeat protein
MKICRLFWPALLAPGALFAAPTDDAYRLYLRGLLEERFGKPEAALAQYEEVVALDPDAAFVHESMASTALRVGRTDKALEAAENVVRLSSATPHPYLVLGRVRLARGELSQAREAFDRALEIGPDDDEAVLYSAHMRLTSEPEEALKLYRRFLQNNPQSLEAQARIAELQQRLGDTDGALASWKKAVEMDPTDFSAHLALAHVYEVRQDTAAAIAEYEACRALDPRNAGVLLRLGELYFRSGRADEALEVFSRALSLSSRDATINFWLALLAEERRDWSEAASRMEVVAAQNEDPSVLLRLAYYHSQSGRGDKSMRWLKRLLKKEPDNPDFLYYVALGYEDLDKPREAIRWLERVIAADPGRADAHFHLATNWDGLKRFEKAEPHLLKAIELDPNHAVALNYLGYSWTERGKDLEKALALIERAVAIDPENGAFLDSLGWAYFKLGRLAEAETALGAAAARMDDPVILEHYGDVLAAAGKTAEALRAWQEGLLLEPAHKGLLKRTGGQADRVLPLTAPRKLLKSVEGNFRQLDSVVGYMQVGGRAERSFRAQGMFYYARPGRFRLEFMGPFFVPEYLLVHDRDGARWRPKDPDDPGWRTGEWLELLGDFLSGELVGRFDAPGVKVEQKGTDLVYTSEQGALTIDGKQKVPRRLLWRAEGAPALELTLTDYRRVDGIWLPARVDCELPERVSLFLELKRVRVNAAVDESLFRLPSEK